MSGISDGPPETGYGDDLQRWSIQVTDPMERQRLLAQYLTVLNEHGVGIPTDPITQQPAVGEPQILDFGFPETDYGLGEWWIAQEDGAGYGGKILVQLEGQVCPFHHHLEKTETFYVLAGTVEIVMGEVNENDAVTEMETLYLRPGSTLRLEPKMGHLFKAIGGPAIIQEFATQCFPKDNIFADKRIGDNGVI